MSTRISSLSIILLAPCLALAPVQAAPTPEFSKLDQAVKAGIGRDRAGGASVAMVHGGKIVSEAHYGFADSASRRQPDSRTIYRIGSVSKAFTAVMLLQLVDRGTVRLTDRADRYVPELRLLTGRPLHSPPVTLIQLATHTAGLPGEPGGPEFDHGPAAQWERKLLAALPATAFASEPGTRFAYSNLGYAILALALSRAAREPYPDYLRRHLFLPLGMTDTSFVIAHADRGRLALGYMVADGKADAAQSQSEMGGRGYKLPVGGAFTTLADMARFLSFQMGDGAAAVLKPETLALWPRLLKTVDPGMGEGYGIGFQLFTNGDVVLRGHTGGLPGYRAMQVFDPESKTGFVILRNALGGRFGDPVMMAFGAFEAP